MPSSPPLYVCGWLQGYLDDKPTPRLAGARPVLPGGPMLAPHDADADPDAQQQPGDADVDLAAALSGRLSTIASDDGDGVLSPRRRTREGYVATAGAGATAGRDAEAAAAQKRGADQRDPRTLVDAYGSGPDGDVEGGGYDAEALAERTEHHLRSHR